MTVALATVIGTIFALLVQWREHRILKRARLQGYGEGWSACDEHRRAHEAVCPEDDPDAAFEAGYKCGLEVAVTRQPQTDDWKRGFEFGFKVADQPCPRCSPKEEQTVN